MFGANFFGESYFGEGPAIELIIIISIIDNGIGNDNNLISMSSIALEYIAHVV